MRGPEALRRAGTQFGDWLELVTADDWGQATPCDAWTVYDLVNHVVGGNFRYAMILNGQDPGVVLGTHGRDALGSDPLGAFRSGLQQVTEAFDSPEALTATVYHPKSGPMSGADLRVLRVSELTVHGWDLARSIGIDQDLDDELVQWLYDCLEPLRATLARSGLYATSIPDQGRSEPVQTRLLHLLGREQ